MADPVGSKTFPIMIGAVAAICGVFLMVKPDPDPDWPAARTFLALGFAVVVLVAYAYALKPLGFLIPTAIAAGVLSYQIIVRARCRRAVRASACRSGCSSCSAMRWG